MDQIRIRGARTHNLKNIDLDLPRNRLVVITGLSGSGKSSLAFDTLYAEGQRRYVESLSAYARQFLQLMEKPDVDLIEGLSPAISIEQKATSHNPRSTVGTVTEIHDYLRLLFARAGTPHCPHHPDQPLEAQSVSQMVDATMALPEGSKLMILAPVVRGRKGEHHEVFESFRAQGFVRFRIRTETVKGTAPARIVEIDDLPTLKKSDKHTIDVVVDRLKIGPDSKQRLAESFETALRHGEGRAMTLDMDAAPDDPKAERIFSNRFACPICSWSLTELEPRLFSFNSPVGACPSCDGLGVTEFFDPKRVVAHPSLSLASGAIKGWDRRNQFYFQMLQSLGQHFEFDVETPFEELPEQVREVVLNGTGKQAIPFTYLNERGRRVVKEHAFEGVLPSLQRRYKETDSTAVREELAKFISSQPCPHCHGTRLRTEARHVRLGEGPAAQPIYAVSALPLREAQRYFEQLKLKGAKAEIADKIVREIAARLRFLNDVGLDYLSLDRNADTLSGGEAQRIRLASQIGSGLTGVMYVLDEPSIGLHQRDNDRLIGTLKTLRDLGNSVLVVEHDEDAIRAADYVVDMGVGAGEHGGSIVSQGTPAQVMDDPKSVTGQFLSGARAIALPRERTPFKQDDDGQPLQLALHGARGNNLKNVTLHIP
ncbi:MAG TPA: excinuclease ABC subunit UvrA, partial [Burkholderiaceae bacterium]|nr:excinuclease ABC subunit UvrA [Burkholderiaceae bacterium]